MNTLKRLWQSVQAFGYPLRSFDDIVPAATSKRRDRHAHQNNLLESMEPRMLLTTLHGGGTLQFLDIDGKVNTVKLAGSNTDTVELIFVNSAGQLTDYVDPAATPDTTDKGMDLFAVIITHSDLNTSFIAYGAGFGTDGKPTGNVYGGASTLWSGVTNSETLPLAPPANAGSVFIGYRSSTGGSNAITNIPVIDVSSINGLNADGVTALSNVRTLRGESSNIAGIYVLPDAGATGNKQSINKIMVDGTVTGNVYVSASINTFYCGWLLTGDASSLSASQNNFRDDNFYVGGDIGSLFVKTSVGTNKTTLDRDSSFGLKYYYDTQVDIHVGGRIGNIKVGGAFVGSVTADNSAAAVSIGLTAAAAAIAKPSYANQIELFTWLAKDTLANRMGVFDQGFLPVMTNMNSELLNNSSDNATHIGTVGGVDSTTVTGTLTNSAQPAIPNTRDFYAVGMTAGQTIKLTLANGSDSRYFLWGIVDTEGRIVATKQGAGALTFTAKEAGVYKIVMALDGDYKFAGTPSWLGSFAYSLKVENLGTLAVGGISSGADMNLNYHDYSADSALKNPDQETASGVVAVRGNIGAIVSGAHMYGVNYSGNIDINDVTHTVSIDFSSVTLLNGNLNAVVGGTIGMFNSNGYISNTLGLDVSGTLGAVVSDGGFLGVNARVGGNIQLLDSSGELAGRFYTKKGIGVIRAGQITYGYSNTLTLLDSNTGLPTTTDGMMTRFTADYDNSGKDGIIDLIDVKGDLGSNGSGGPRITTGTGGNVRYFHISDTSRVYQDGAWNTGDTGTNRGSIVYYSGETIPELTDDSGAKITITPTSNADSTLRVRIWTYAIWGTGGVAVLRVESNFGLNVSVRSGNNNSGQSAEIGEIDFQKVDIDGNGSLDGDGAALVDTGTNGAHVNPPATITTTTTTTNSSGQPVTTTTTAPAPYRRLTITGDFRLDVFKVSSSETLNFLTNSTVGDIVNVEAGDIGVINLRGRLGESSSTIGNELNQIEVIANTYPFDQLHNGVKAAYVGDIIVEKSIGALVISGSVNQIIANSQLVDDPDVREGFNAPITIGGNVNFINIGEGLAASGIGNNPNGGIFVGGVLYSLVGANSDIRADIVTGKGVRNIQLTNGSIIGALIGVFATNSSGATTFEQAWRYNSSYMFANALDANGNGGTTSKPIYEIGTVSITGNGGIMGSRFLAADIQSINVADTGFGVVSSYFWTSASGVIDSVYAGGWGLANVTFNTYKINRLATISDPSKIKALNLSDYAYSAQLSNQYLVNPYTGQSIIEENPAGISDYPNSLAYYTDLKLFYEAMRSSYFLPYARASNITTGMIVGCYIGAQEMGSVTTYGLEDNKFYIGNAFKSVNVTGNIANNFIQTGSLSSLTVGTAGNNTTGDSIASVYNITGEVGNITLLGDLDAQSTIYAKGGSSSAGSINVKGDFAGTLIAAGKISNLNVGTAPAKGVAGSGLFTGTIKLLGDVAAGNVNFYGVNNGAATILIDGKITGVLNFAAGLGADLSVKGDVGTIKIGTDPLAGSSGITGNITVEGNLGSLVVRGGLGAGKTLNVFGDLGALTLNGGSADTALLAGNVIVGGKITTINVNGANTLAGGSLTGYIQAVKSIGTINVVNGDIASTAVIKSLMSGITGVVVTNGIVDGTISAHGTIGLVDLRKPAAKTIARTFGSIGDDADISAASITKLNVLGNIESGAAVTVSGMLNTLSVIGSVGDDATITAGMVKSFNVTGNFNGDLALTRPGQSNVLTIKGSIGNAVTLSQSINVAGSLTLNLPAGSFGSKSTLMVDGNLASLAMSKGDLAGNILVNGVISKITAATMTGAAITAGSDITSITLSGVMSNSLIQAGISRGSNGTLATGTSQMANIGTISVGGTVGGAGVTDSVIAAGGSIKSFSTKGIMSGSSLSSGLVYTAAHIQGAITDVTPLTDAAERANLRSGGTLFHGDILSVSVNGAKADGLKNASAITAGISAGVDGNFGTGDDSVNSTTGGTSTLKSVKALIPAADASVILAETPSSRSVNGLDQAGINAYTTTPTGTLVAPTLQKGNTYTYVINGQTLTITVSKGVTVQVYDDAATNGVVDSIVISGPSTSAGSVTIVAADPNSLQIGRVLATDDTNLGTFVFNGDIVGVGNPSIAALQIDSNMTKFSVRSLATNSNWVGTIGGDVGTLTITNQGSGALTIAGTVKNLTIANSTGSPTTGIVANAFGTITLGASDKDINNYAGRIESRAVGTVGIGSIKVLGAATSSFQGNIVAAGSIGTVTATNASFNGSITAKGDAKSITFTKAGSGVGSVISIDGALGTLTVGGTLAGNVTTGSLATFNVAGGQNSTSTVNVAYELGTLSIGGDVSGRLNAGALGKGTIKGLLKNTNLTRFHIAGDVTTGLNLTGGTDTGSLVMVDGSIASLVVKGDHKGTVATGIGGDVNSASFVNVNGGLLIAAGDIKGITASGDVTNSLFSAGVYIGTDGDYNSTDDVVYGGNIVTATFSGEYKDSVIAAGVLPKYTGTTGFPTDRRYFSGDPTSSSVDNVDPAQTGGITRSTIGTVTFRKLLVDTSPNNGTKSVVVAADAINKTSYRGTLTTRVIGNPSDNLTAVSATRVDTNKIEVIFDQPIDTHSINNVSVRVLNNANVNYAGVSFKYEVRPATADTRDNDYVLVITNSASFDGTSILPDKVVLKSGVAGNAVMNHAGSRSAKLLDLNNDGSPDYQPLAHDVTLPVGIPS